MCDEIICIFPDFNGATVEIWERICYFIPRYTGHVNLSMLGLRLIRVSKRGSWGELYGSKQCYLVSL